MGALDHQLHRELEQLFNIFLDAEGPVGEWASHGYSLTDPERKSILFVGLNPSYRDKPQQTSYGCEGYSPQDQYPQFFAPFQQLANDCQRGDDWAYTDVFYQRELELNKLPEAIETPEGREFITRQLRFTMRLLEYLKPDLMVVCHPEAHRFFGKSDLSRPHAEPWMGYEFEFNTAFGVDVITGISSDSIERGAKTTGLVGTPVLFASTLTYMDRASKRRLAWQMEQILKFYSLFDNSDANDEDDPISVNIAKVAMKIARLQKAKSELVKKRHYGLAAQKRDQIAEVKEEVLELLVRVVGE